MWFKRTRTGVAALCLAGMLGFSPFVVAQNASDYFKQGVKAAESGKYRAALVKFQKAKKAGLDSIALKYNFAVTFYKLGQYEEAKKLFTELAGVPKFKQIAYYNLGLVANKQKDKSMAVRWFRRAYWVGKNPGGASKKNKKIKVLAAEALKRLGAPLRKKSSTNKKWKGYVSAAMSSDSNVTRVNEEIAGAVSQSDTSVVLSAYGAKWLLGRGSGGVRFFLNAYLRQYSTQNLYDYERFKVGLARYDYLGSWRLRYGGNWSEATFGGKKYQRLLSAEVRGRKPLSGNTQLHLRYKASQISATNPVYDYLEGSRQQFRVGARIKTGADRFRVYYQLELNDRQDFVGVSPVFSSYSPTRHTLRVTGRWKYFDGWAVRLGGRYRISKYNDDNVFSDGTIDGTAERREDSQTRFTARLTKKFDKNWRIGAEYRVTNNNSSIDPESYDRSQISVDIKRKF